MASLHLLPRSVGIAFRVVLLLAIAAGSYRAVLLAWADLEYRQGRPAAVRKAEHLMPANSVYHYTNALILQQNEPASPLIEKEFSAAVSDNPRYSDALLAWSVEKELRGDKRGALNLLLRAKEQDRLLRPAWALANFYYRQGNTERLVEAARDCLRIIGDTGLSAGRFDPVPIFELCWKAGADPTTILNRVLPDHVPLLDHYLSYLFNSGRLDAAKQAAARIYGRATPTEMLFLRPYIDVLIRNHRIEEAIRAWKQIASRKLVPYPGPDTQRGVFLTDGSFAGPPLNFGFDWQPLFPETVLFSFSPADHSYRFDFDGSEPEQFSVLRQTLPILEGKSYRLTVRFNSDVDPERSGLRWGISDHSTAAAIPARVSVAGGEGPRTLTMDFETPPNTALADLLLAYQRQPGTARLRGFLELLHADLKLR